MHVYSSQKLYIPAQGHNYKYMCPRVNIAVYVFGIWIASIIIVQLINDDIPLCVIMLIEDPLLFLVTHMSQRTL